MLFPRPAIAANTTDQMPLARDAHALFKALDLTAKLNNVPSKFMPDHHRYGNGLLRPLVPLVNVQVRSTNTDPVDLDKDVMRSNFRPGYFLQPKTFPCFLLNEGFHSDKVYA